MLSTSEIIKKYGLDAKKSLGQNFILDKNFTDKIAKSAFLDGENPADFEVLEIGPGPGSLTRSILDMGVKKLYAIEKDLRCIEALQELKNFYGERLEIINQDALTIDEVEFFNLTNNKKIKIIANLPYNIGTVLLIKWLKIADKISSMTLMLQKEVAQRIAAKVNDNHYGRLAIMVNHLAKTKILYDVNKSNFTPPPKVTSAIIQIIPFAEKIYDVEFLKIEKLLAQAFSQRRKMIKSSLKGFVFKDLTLEEALKKADIEATLRPENIEIAKFCALAKLS